MDKKIRMLTERFMAGRTTIEEERLLAEYFRTHEVGGEWSAYKEMFAWFDEDMPLADGRAAPGVEDAPAGASAGRLRAKRIWIYAAAAVAAVVLLVTVWPGGGRMTSPSLPPLWGGVVPLCSLPTGEGRGEASHGGVAAAYAPDTAVTDTAATEAVKSKGSKRKRTYRMRKDAYRIMPPKTYLAEKMKDSAFVAKADILAEERLREIYEAVEDSMDMLEEQYIRMERSIDTYVTALDDYDDEEYY